MDFKNIIVGGDSIARGQGDADGYYSWPEMMAPRLAKHLNSEIGLVNISVGGVSSKEVTVHFKAVAPSVLFLAAIIFAFGANDIKHWGKDRSAPFQVPVDEREKVWCELFTAASNLKPDVPIFAVSVMPVDPAVYENPNNGLDVYRCNADIDDYNRDLSRVCADLGVHFIDATGQIDHTKWVSTLVDGIHPDGRGQGMLADQVYQALERVL